MAVKMSSKLLLGLGVFFATLLWCARAWGDPGKVTLRDIQVLTLKIGKMTTGRRASPVPQIKCVGGSAQGAFNPLVVQCYNRGWDGQDVQWECKADMDNLYRFGEVEVVCEGYDYADDPHILGGSCGLEYTLEYTKEGHDKQKSNYNYGQPSERWFGRDSHNNYGSTDKSTGKWGGIGDLVVLGAIAFMIYIFYKTCISSGDGIEDRQYSSTSGDHPSGGGGGGGGWFNPGSTFGTGNRGYGFADNASCNAGRRQRGTGGTGGFWAGLGLGGLAGYMLGGNRNRGHYGYGNRGDNNYGWGGASRGWGWGGGGGSGSSNSSSTPSGTRTASGFGGTRRR